MAGSWARVWAGVVELLAAQGCAACGWVPGLQGDELLFGFCQACRLLLEPVPEGLGPPVPHAALYVYGGPLAEAVQRFKYGGRYELAQPLGALLREWAWSYAGRVDRVVPMPLHPARLRARGFNQVALLAAPLARELGVPLDVAMLQRIRPTLPQAGLDRGRRTENVRGAFKVRSGRRPPGRVLLVDDVRTSGASLGEATAALRAAAAVEVCTLTLAMADM